MKISLAYNAVPASAEKELLEVFRSGQFSPGPKVRAFEEQFAKLHGARYGVFVNSGTDALRIALAAMKEQYRWRDGDRVAVPALTFVATVNVILQNNLTPFFVDVGMNDYLINPWNLGHTSTCEEDPQILTTIKAVMPVHLFGKRCGGNIFELAKKYGWKVLEDSCETILNPVRGDVSCHSTYMAHHVTTGVGGMALTNDQGLREVMWSYANHGRREAKKFTFDRVGYSCRATEFEAVLGLSQLPFLQENIRQRREVAKVLLGAFQSFPDIATDLYDPDHTYMMLPVVLSQTSHIEKKELCTHLEKHGIETRDMMPITTQPCYRAIFEGLRNEQRTFSVAEWLNRDGFYIPCHPGMVGSGVRHVVDVFRLFLPSSSVALDMVEEVV